MLIYFGRLSHFFFWVRRTRCITMPLCLLYDSGSYFVCYNIHLLLVLLQVVPCCKGSLILTLLLYSLVSSTPSSHSPLSVIPTTQFIHPLLVLPLLLLSPAFFTFSSTHLITCPNYYIRLSWIFLYTSITPVISQFIPFRNLSLLFVTRWNELWDRIVKSVNV